MIHEIKKFGADLQTDYDQDSEIPKPPLTYEAYNAALRQYLYEFNSRIIDIERDVTKQGKPFVKFMRNHLYL